MDKNEDLMRELNEKRAEAHANSLAMKMFIDLLEVIAPDDMKDMLHVPKLINRIDDKTRALLTIINKSPSPEDKAIATDACVLLSRIDEALEAFIEQHTGGDA